MFYASLFLSCDSVVHPGFIEGRYKFFPSLKSTFSAGQSLKHFFVGLDGVRNVFPVTVGHVLSSVWLQQLNAHADNGFEEVPEVLITIRGHWRVS